jgi:hypothetical protein
MSFKAINITSFINQKTYQKSLMVFLLPSFSFSIFLYLVHSRRSFGQENLVFSTFLLLHNIFHNLLVSKDLALLNLLPLFALSTIVISLMYLQFAVQNLNHLLRVSY